jgi:lipopolysaccharide/colanic/teichoic acid biosynthesis glycosyltransferase
MSRALDIAGAAFGLTAAWPILAIAAAAVKVSMGSPVLFCQLRPGLKATPFLLYKFRTMRTLAHDEDPGSSDASRLTSVGKVLRSTSIDELPTLFNVLKGDMSLIGPRPLLMQYLGRYSARQARRHEVKPGITGWAQVHGRNAISWEEKFDHDVWYVDNRSLVLDARILLMTIAQVVRREGISHEGAATMPEFMGSAGNHRTMDC